MKLLKRLSISLWAIVLVYLILCFAGPKKLEMKKSTEVNAIPETIYDYLIDLDSWDSWSPWMMADSTMEIAFMEKKKGLGAGYSWTSEQSGDGSLEFVEASTNKYLKTKMSFSSWKGNSFGTWKLEVSGPGKTNLSWAMDADRNIGFLSRGMMLLNGSKSALGRSLEKGLENLKKLAEYRTETAEKIQVSMIDQEARTLLIKRGEVSFEDITSFYAEQFGMLAKATLSKKIQIDGMPMGLFFSWDTANQKTKMAAAMPVSEVFNIKNAEFYPVLPGKSLVVDHYGDYNSLSVAHDAIRGFAAKNNIKTKRPYLEEYLNDPSLVNDASEVHTRVIYYIEE